MEWALLLQPLRELYKQKDTVFALFVSFRKRPFAIFICCLLVVCTIVLTWQYSERSGRYDAFVVKAFGDKGQREEHSALEALLLADIDGSVLESFKSQKIDSDIDDTWKSIVDDSLQIENNVSVSPQSPIELSVAAETVPVLTEKKRVSPDSSPTEYPGFLFAPYYLFTPPPAADLERKILSGTARPFVVAIPLPDEQGKSYIVDPSVYKQIDVSERLAQDMQDLSSLSFVSSNIQAANALYNKPVQSYIILSGGITRVFISREPHPSKFFGTQFPATTFFPERPYFWPVFNQTPKFFTLVRRPTKKDAEPYKSIAGTQFSDFFRISEPYLDLGGSGVVITLSRGLILDGVVKAVICIDLRFPDAISRPLEKTITGLEGKTFELTCNVTFEGKQIDCGDENKFPEDEAALYREVHNEFASSSADVLSRVFRFGSGSDLKFSVPLLREIKEDGTQTVSLFIASVDLSTFRAKTLYLASFAVAAFVLLVMYLAYLWGSLELNRTEYHKAFTAVDEVMKHCPVPYLRLDGNDRISVFNSKFAEMLGYQEAELTDMTLASLCSGDDSQRTYAEVEESRKASKPVVPYSLTLRKNDKSEIRVQIYSAPVPSAELGRLPETFGILVEH